eukprot:Skav220281  [mRNA]  locus=scaffold915:62742:72034:+ [translate_table: standard]
MLLRQVSDWFGSLIPRGFPQRTIALTAAGHTTKVLQELRVALEPLEAQGRRPEPDCAKRAATTHKVMAAFRAFATWAVALPRKQRSCTWRVRNGTVVFGGVDGTGAAGVALIWMNQAAAVDPADVETLPQMLRLAEVFGRRPVQELCELPQELGAVCAAAARVKFYDPGLFETLGPALKKCFQMGLDAPGQAGAKRFSLLEDVAFLSQLRADQGPPASTREGLNTAGLPMRPGARICESFAKNGTCRVGTACRFDHPEGMKASKQGIGSLRCRSDEWMRVICMSFTIVYSCLHLLDSNLKRFILPQALLRSLSTLKAFP